MRCLFCGKELALLKRLRGGAEFCSEAHRKEYQDQYEQLALARLLQAKPPSEPATPLNPLDPRLENSFAPAQFPGSVATIEAAAPFSEAQAETDLEAAWPASEEHAEENSPAPMAGFMSDPVVPAVASFEQAGLLELDNAWERETALPTLSAAQTIAGSAASEGSQGCLPPAPRVALALSLQALEHHTRTSERGLELREFTGPAPILELNLRPETGAQPAGAADSMEILMSPLPPQKAKSWLGLPRGFPAARAELGDLARLDFATSGFAYSDSSASATTPTAVLAPEVPTLAPQVFPDAPPRFVQRTEPAPEAFTAPVDPAPAQSLPAQPAPPS